MSLVASSTTTTSTSSSTSNMQAHAVRLGPGTDLVPALHAVVHELLLTCTSCCIVTAVGSLRQVSLRMAAGDSSSYTATNPDNNNNNNNNGTHPECIVREYHECVEIVSLVGTFSRNNNNNNDNNGGGGKQHLHMSVSRRDGSVLGGHLMGGIIFTTLELVLATMPGISFTRELDAATGYDELVVRSLPLGKDDKDKEANTEEKKKKMEP